MRKGGNMEYSQEVIEEIIKCNYPRLENDEFLNKSLILIAYNTETNDNNINKKDLLLKFNVSKHTLNRALDFAEGMGLITKSFGKDHNYKLTGLGRSYLIKYISSTAGSNHYNKVIRREK